MRITNVTYHRWFEVATIGALVFASACANNDSGPGRLPDDCGVDRDRPNDPAGMQSQTDAVVAKLDAAHTSLVLSPLSLCPSSDIDVFRVDGIGAGWQLQVELEIGEATDAGVNMSIQSGPTILESMGPVAGGIATWTGDLTTSRWIDIRGASPSAAASYALRLLVVQTPTDDHDDDDDDDDDDDIDEDVDEEVDEHDD